MNLVIQRNPQANVVFEINSDGVMEHYSGLDESGKIITYDKKSGDGENSNMERLSYTGLTEYYKKKEESLFSVIKNQSDTIYRLRNIVLFGSLAAVAAILVMVLFVANGNA